LFIVNESGYKSHNNPNFRGDGIMLFGRKTEKMPALNDVYFHLNDT